MQKSKAGKSQILKREPRAEGERAMVQFKITNFSALAAVFTFALPFFIFAFCFLLSPAAYAQQEIEGYQLSVGLPEFPSLGDAGKTGETLASFFTYIFYLSLILSALAGFVALLFGGIMYMTSAVVESKSRAREIIQGAFVGILLLVSTYMILGYVNPKLRQSPLPTFPKPKAPEFPLTFGKDADCQEDSQCMSKRCDEGKCDGSAPDEKCADDVDCLSGTEIPDQYFCDNKKNFVCLPLWTDTGKLCRVVPVIAPCPAGQQCYPGNPDGTCWKKST